MAWRESKRRDIMLCYPFEEKRLVKWGGRAVVQPKLDGIRCRAVWNEEEGRWVLLSSEANEIVGVPHINEALRGLPAKEYDGELYTHGMPFEEIVSRAKRQEGNIHPQYHQLQYHIFDLVSPLPQIGRLLDLKNILSTDGEAIQRVQSYVCRGVDQVMGYYRSICARGYEGIIARKLDGMYERRRYTGIMKFKPKKKDWYRITGWKEEVGKHGEPKGSLGAIIFRGDDGSEGSVGSGLTAAQRKDLWNGRDGLIGRLVEVEYQHITPGKGVPRFPVFIRIIDPNKWEEGEDD